MQEAKTGVETNRRYLLLDTLRGILLLAMVLYHLGWDLVYLFSYKFSWFTSVWVYLCQQSICWSFILLSGYCIGLKQNQNRRKSTDREQSCPCREEGISCEQMEQIVCWNCKNKDIPEAKRLYGRGLAVLAAGTFITLVTVPFFPQTPNIFGVLFFLGCAMLSSVFLQNVLHKVPVKLGFTASIAAFFLLRNINRHSLGFESLRIGELSDSWYNFGLPGAFLGLPGADFYSADYFSFIPWYFLFLAGYFLYGIFPAEKFSCLFNKGNRGLAFLGKNSLLFYLLHQPLILVLLYLGLFR